MISGADHENPVVAFEAIDFVEEVGAHTVGDDAVEVFEDKVAWRELARFMEDGGDGVLRASVGGKRADIEGGYWGREAGQGVHGCFDGDGFPIACREGLD